MFLPKHIVAIFKEAGTNIWYICFNIIYWYFTFAGMDNTDLCDDICISMYYIVQKHTTCFICLT